MLYRENNYFYKAINGDDELSLIQRILVNVLYAALGINPNSEQDELILTRINNALSVLHDRFLNSTELKLLEILENINKIKNINLLQINFFKILKDICLLGMGPPSWKWIYKWLTVPASMLAELMVSGLRDGILQINIEIKNFKITNPLVDIPLVIVLCVELILQICANTIAFFTHWFTRGSIIGQIVNLFSELSSNRLPNKFNNFFDFYIDLQRDSEKMLQFEISKSLDKSPDTTLTTLLSMCNDDDNIKAKTIIHLIDQKKQPEDFFQKFKSFAQENKKSFATNIDLITKTKLLNLVGLENLIELSDILYDNEWFKNVFLVNAFKCRKPIAFSDEQETNFIKSLLSNISDLDSFKQIYNYIGVSSHLKPEDVLNLLASNKKLKCDGLKDSLDISLEDALTTDGLNYISKLFKGINLKEYKFNSIFLYFDLCTKDKLLPRYLKNTELKDRILSILFQRKPFMDEAEYEQLNSLGLSLSLPRMQELCNAFLNSNINKIPEIKVSIAKIKTLQAQGAALFAADFLALIQNLTDDNILKFVKQYCLDNNDVAEEQKSKLCSFFKHNISTLAYILSQNNGLTKLIGTIGALADGCAANIGTQMQLATFTLLFENDLALRILYSCFTDSIVVPFFRRIGEDHLGAASDGANPFKNQDILNLKINPPGLVAALVNHYCDKQGNNIINPLENDIGQLITGAPPTSWVNHCLIDFLDTKFDTADPDFSKKSAELAAYLVLEQLYPSILLHPLLKEFNDTYSQHAQALHTMIYFTPSLSCLMLEVFEQYSIALSKLLAGSYHSPIINSDIYGLGCIQRDPSAQELKQSHAVMVP